MKKLTAKAVPSPRTPKAPPDFGSTRPRIELTVFTDNEPAIALYRKFGFEIEGALRKYAFRDREFVDAYAMARVK